MNLEKMKQKWQSSFKLVLKKVYELGKAIKQHQLDGRETFDMKTLYTTPRTTPLVNERNSSNTLTTQRSIQQKPAPVEVLEYKQVQYTYRARRINIGPGDPALYHIPPQRDIIVLLHCDNFPPLSKTVTLADNPRWREPDTDSAWPHEWQGKRYAMNLNCENTAALLKRQILPKEKGRKENNQCRNAISGAQWETHYVSGEMERNPPAEIEIPGIEITENENEHHSLVEDASIDGCSLGWELRREI